MTTDTTDAAVPGARNATLADLAAMLREQQARKVDIVAPAGAIRARDPLADPQEAVAVVSQRLRFTDAEQAQVMSHFIRAGQVSAGGVMHAVTSVAQTLPDADAAHEMEAAGLRALEIAASL